MRKFLKIFVITLAVFAIAFSIFSAIKFVDWSKLSLLYPRSRINRVRAIDYSDQKAVNSSATVQILLIDDGSVTTGGSGFFVNEKGYIITCHHVIKQAVENTNIHSLIVFEGHTYKVEIIDYDSEMDLGLLRVKTSVRLPFVRFADSEKMSIDDQMVISAIPPNANDLDKKIDFNKVERITSSEHRILKPDQKSFFSNPQVIKFFKNDADHGWSILDPEIRDFFSNPKNINYFSDREIMGFLSDPEILKTFSGSKAEKFFQNFSTYLFFLKNQETRIFFTDPEKNIKPGCSGGACFNEKGGCVGMVQEICFSLIPEERSERGDFYPSGQYYFGFPQVNFIFFMLFPQIDVILGSGRSSNIIVKFLEENEIKFYRMEENK